MQVCIITDDTAQNGGWHGAKLAAAFIDRGIVVNFVALQDCLIDLSAEKSIIQIPGLNELPKAVFVRGIAGGSFQQITTRLNILHGLKMLGVAVYNDGKSIERAVDKAMTSFLLHHAGVGTPKTWVCESRHLAHMIIKNQCNDIHNKTYAHDKKDTNENHSLVIKPLFGSQGVGVRIIDDVMPLPRDQFVEGVYYLQQFIAAKHDYRVFIIDNKVIAAMRRTGEGWLHNVAKGAICEFIEDADVCEIALRAALVLDISYCGVDIIRDINGQLLVLEVNSIPAWRGLQSVTDIDIAQTLVDDFLSKIN